LQQFSEDVFGGARPGQTQLGKADAPDTTVLKVDDEVEELLRDDEPGLRGDIQIETDKPATRDWMTSVEDLFGSELGRGGSTRAVTGDLQAQLGAWSDLEGTFRADYNWTTMGEPRTPKEAFMFLSQAQGDPANQITFTLVGSDDPLFKRAQRILSADATSDGIAAFGYNESMLVWANDIIRIATMEGGQLYTRGGEVVTDQDEIMRYKNMVRFKATAQVLVNQFRMGRQNLFEWSTKQGYALALETKGAASAAAIARIQQESAEAVANIQAWADSEVEASRAKTAKLQATTQKEISAAEVVGRADVAGIQATGALDVAGEQSSGALAVAKERSSSGLEIAKEQSSGAKAVEIERGTQDVKRIQEQAVLDIANIEAKRDADMGLLTEELDVRQSMATQEQDAALLRITRESDAQQILVQLSADLDMELETSKQGWQTAENNKQLAIQEGNLQESIRASFMQEQIQIEQQQIERETNSLNMLMNISQNPALLYFMKESGMLSGVGETLLGEDTASLIDDLTASIDPGNLPNIQTYNAMSELQQQISSFRTGATTGMSPKAQQEYLLGASPFTRGQKSTIRVGSRINPFETMNA
jgi:hypothetical protein